MLGDVDRASAREPGLRQRGRPRCSTFFRAEAGSLGLRGGGLSLCSSGPREALGPRELTPGRSPGALLVWGVQERPGAALGSPEPARSCARGGLGSQ